MKRLFVAMAIVASSAYISYGACMLGQAFCADESGQYVGGILQDGNGTGMPSMTKAQMQAATPRVAGQEIYCSDCTRAYLCISSGTTIGGYVVAVESATTVTKTHCQ